MARGPAHSVVGLAALRRWRRRLSGEALALDLSPMVARPAELGGNQGHRGPGWPRGVQEDDGVRWRWDRPAPTTAAPGERRGEGPPSTG